MIDILKSECKKLGYEPRDVQVKAVEFLSTNWESGRKCKVLSLPTGSGKSVLAKTISEYNKKNGLITAIITPQNILIEQYVDEFPSLNFLKGKTHYKCKSLESNCLEGEAYAKISKKQCEDCPYRKSKEKTYVDFITIFNPLSYIGFKKLEESETGRNIIYDVDTIIVDEFQSLASMLRELSTIKIWENDIKWEKGVTSSIKNVIKLLNNYSEKLSQFICSPMIDKKEKTLFYQIQRKVDFIADQLQSEPNLFVCEEISEKRYGVESDCIQIRPVYCHPNIHRNFFKIAKNVVLMSGTAFPYMYRELGFNDDDIDYIDLPSPIPVERRLTFALSSINLAVKNKDSFTIKTLAEQIKFICDVYHPNENGVVLLPYNLAEELKDYLKEKKFIHMDKNSKKDKINKFKEGKEYYVGVFSGSYEGLSLNGDLSRFTIIPKVTYPNLMDGVVKKRKTNSEINYALETITVMIQAAGRSTRSEKDYSYTYILDESFPRLYGQIRTLAPKYFKDSVVFSAPTLTHLENLNNFRKGL